MIGKYEATHKMTLDALTFEYKMLKKIKEIVTPEEMSEIDRVIEEIYSIDDGSNHSVAFQLGFDTVANQNGSGYKNLVLIADQKSCITHYGIKSRPIGCWRYD